MRAQLAKIAWSALGGDAKAVDNVFFTASGGLASPYAVTDFASATIATAGLAVAELVRALGGGDAAVSVDRRLASIWFGSSLRPIGWSLPPVWDPIAGNYRTRDGWIRLHTNAPHHRAAAERILGAGGVRSAVAAAVAGWRAGELEAAIIEADGCAAQMRSTAEWERHSQGRAVAAEPLVHVEPAGAAAERLQVDAPPARPLRDVRVLDLTRVLAGPVASRFLAGYGADVLRIDPPGWEEASLVPEVTLGKRCARLDLREPADREVFEGLLAGADVLLHGYRPGALERLGFGEAARRRIAPLLIDVALCAYGWSGPWAARRGFDSLVQMSAGIADTGMRWRRSEVPVPLPVQALDHATGYLMAAAAIRAVTRRLGGGPVTSAKLSLARTALLLRANPARGEPPFAPEGEGDVSDVVEDTPWGSARRVAVPLSVAGAPLRWDSPACDLGSSPPAWRARRESNPHLRV